MIYVSPESSDRPVIAFIQQAQGNLIINNYMITDKGIIQAIKVRDENGGAKTIVILEPHPFGVSKSLVDREEAELEDAGAQVVFPPDRFTDGRVFDHAKYAVAENEAMIGTANLTEAAARKNREFEEIFGSDDSSVIAALNALARADLNNQPDPQMPANLVVAPEPDTVSKMKAVIDQPGPVYITSEEIQPTDPLNQAIEAKGHEAYLILPGKLTESEVSTLGELAAAGVNIKLLSSPYMHAKIITGSKETFLGSENLSETSLEHNREVGVILSTADNRNDVMTISTTFQHDWSIAEPFTGQAENEEASNEMGYSKGNTEARTMGEALIAGVTGYALGSAFHHRHDHYHRRHEEDYGYHQSY